MDAVDGAPTTLASGLTFLALNPPCILCCQGTDTIFGGIILSTLRAMLMEKSSYAAHGLILSQRTASTGDGKGASMFLIRGLLHHPLLPSADVSVQETWAKVSYRGVQS